MKTKSSRSAGNQPATTKKPKPLTVTFTGDIADEIRAVSKQLGQRAATTAALHLRFGLLSSGTSTEAREYQLETAARYIGLSMGATSELHAHAKRAEAEYVARLRAESTEVPNRKKR